MAAFDPIAAGGVPFDPNAAGGTPVPSSGFGPLTPNPAAPGMVSGGGFAAGNPPGFDATTVAGAEQQKAMTARAQSYATDMYPLLKAQQEWEIAPTGKGTDSGFLNPYELSAKLRTTAPEWLQRGLSFWTNEGGLIGGGIMTPEQTDAYGLLKKLLTQGQLAVPGATRSNEGGATAQGAFPNVEMPPAAGKLALQGIIGLRRMEQDQTMQWHQSGLGVQALPNFVADFQTKADPRVYIWDQQSGPQRQKILDGMTPAQRGIFIKQVQRADNNGIYNTFGMGAPPK